MRILDKLDFTLYQKRIIEVLLKNYKLSASMISKKTKIAPNKVYQTMNDLISKSIVIETNTKPKLYTLINFDNYLKEAIERKQREVVNLENEYDSFLETYKQHDDMQDEFWVLENMSALMHKIEPTMQNLQEENIGLIEEWTIRYSLLKIVKQKVREGKSIRFITKFSSKNIPAMKKWLQCGIMIKHYDMDLQSGYGVFDKKHVKISLKQRELKSIWIENESLGMILHDYFENVWEKAQDITLENIDNFKI